MDAASRTSDTPPIHFIGGIHGVGKTTFASAVSHATGLVCESAGALIKKHRDSTQGTAKQVLDVNYNQNLLLNAIKELRLSASLLLDGHFCLLTKENSISQIPLEIFAGLNLRSIAVVTDTPVNIQHRLKLRDGTDFDTDLLGRFQTEELAWAEEIAIRLRIPFAALNCAQVPQATEHIFCADRFSRQ